MPSVHLPVSSTLPDHRCDRCHTAPDKAWWTTGEGLDYPTIVNWTPVPGARAYEICIQEYDLNGNPLIRSTTTYENTGNGVGTFCDMRWALSQPKEGSIYRIQIRALSGNIELLKHSEVKEYDIPYKSQEAQAEEVKESIIADGVEAAVENTDIKEFAEILKNSAEVLEEVVKEESKHIEAKGITVLPPVSTVAEIAANTISVVGAGLNVEGGSVGLVINEPAKKLRLTVNCTIIRCSLRLRSTEQTEQSVS